VDEGDYILGLAFIIGFLVALAIGFLVAFIIGFLVALAIGAGEAAIAGADVTTGADTRTNALAQSAMRIRFM